jgi:anti-anti-sigma regulatory factor
LKGFEMEIVKKEENGIVFLAFKGRLDGKSALEAEDTINRIFKGENNVLGAAKEMKRRDGKFVLCALNAYVKEVFEVSGFGAIIPIADSVESGINEIS